MTKWERQERDECERAIEDARFRGEIVCRCGNTPEHGLHYKTGIISGLFGCARGSKAASWWECLDCGEEFDHKYFEE
jgi:hypothetical protein